MQSTTVEDYQIGVTRNEDNEKGHIYNRSSTRSD